MTSPAPHLQNQRHRQSFWNLPSLIITTVSVLLIVASTARFYRWTRSDCPSDPWEAAIVTNAERVAHGEPMYAAMQDPTGLEPGIYAPLQTLVVAQIFRITGPSLLPLRLMNLAAGFLFIALILRALKLPKDFRLTVLSLAVLLAVDRLLSPICGLWALPRADAVALLAGLIYVIAGYRAIATDSMKWVALALVVLALGFFWKQTILAVAPVPFLAGWICRGASRRMRIAFFVGPPMIVGISVVLIRTFHPNMYEAMFHFAAKYALRWSMPFRYAYGGLLAAPLFWFTLVRFISIPDSPIHDRKRFLWAATVAVVALPLDFLTLAKIGGEANSLAHLFYGATAMVLCCLPEMLTFISSEAVSLIKRSLFSAMLMTSIVVMWISTLYYATTQPPENLRPYGEENRGVLLSVVSRLSGKVVSPQDPTIALFAKGYGGVSAINEWDHWTWHWPLPKTILELRSADYVVTWGKKDSTELWSFDDGYAMLPGLGFVPLEIPQLATSHYQIWQHRP